jgi:hypothetical protein
MERLAACCLVRRHDDKHLNMSLPRFVSEGHNSFEVESSPRDEVNDVDQARVRHQSGCTVKRSGRMQLASAAGTDALFASVFIDGQEYLVDCMPGVQDCNLVVVLEGGANTSSIALSPPGRKMVWVFLPYIIMPLIGVGVGIGAGAGAGAATKSGGCFPADALVTSMDGRLMRMDQLQQGDQVLSMLPTGSLSWQEVYMFGHKDPHPITPFVTIKAANSTIQLTPGGCQPLSLGSTCSGTGSGCGT